MSDLLQDSISQSMSLSRSLSTFSMPDLATECDGAASLGNPSQSSGLDFGSRSLEASDFQLDLESLQRSLSHREHAPSADCSPIGHSFGIPHSYRLASEGCEMTKAVSHCDIETLQVIPNFVISKL